MAVILLSAAWAMWRGDPAPAGARLGLGRVIYSTINSAGYYAQRCTWEPVALFAALLAAVVVAALRIGIAG